MSQPNTSRKWRVPILILSVLLALSLCAQGGVLVYNHLAAADTTVSLPDNLITPDAAPTTSADSDADSATADSTTRADSDADTAGGQPSATTGATAESLTAGRIRLNAKHPDDNRPFTVTNLFPGDTVTQNFCVQVSYRGTVTVCFATEWQSGDRELMDALNMRIKALGNDRVLYNGPFTDMPTDLAYTLQSDTETQTDLYYEIQVSLPESAGNEYQSRRVSVDFLWWVAESENLAPPATGDTAAVAWTAGITALSALFCLILLAARNRRKEAERHD